MAETTDVAVIGAGPAGLAVGACLRRAGLGFIILEREDQVGASWRKHYERLHLHTVKHFSSLPFLPFPKSYPRYVPRNLMIEYLEAYADRFALQPRFGDAVRSVRRDGEQWIVGATTSAIRAPCVVLASGYNAEASLPALPGIDTFKGQVIHSAHYANARPFAGKSVLVIGMGNTGAEVALDLAEGGARPTISVRDGVHVVPRELFGLPIQIVAMAATTLLSPAVNDIIFPPILDLALGNLSRHGLNRPKQGILQQIASAAKIPVIDVGTVARIAAGEIKVAPGIKQIMTDGAAFNDGKQTTFDAIVFATGYHPNYRSYLEADVAAPPAAAPMTTSAGLFFVGYRNVVTGLLHEIGKEAVQVAATIARRRHSSRAT